MYFKKIIKKTHLLILLLAIFMPWQAKAQETVTVCDGTAPGTTTATNSYIPIYGSYVDTQGTTSEFIIPATTEGMDALIGGVISQLTFYISNSPATWGSPVVQIYMGEVESTTLSGLYGPTNANVMIVAEKTLSNTQAEMEIEIDTPYTYEGGNLLVGTYVKTKSDTYKATSFSGISAPSGSSWNKYSSYNSGSAQSFLPKTTFTYTPAGGVSCAKPKNFNATGITAYEATLTWTAGDEESNWDVFVTTDSEVVPDDETTPTYQVTTCSKELTGLTAQTTYYAYVRANCGGDFSKWVKKVFSTTRVALTVDATHPYSQDFEASNDWGFENGSLTNNWCWGSAVNNGGEKSMYVSKDGGTTYEYAHGNTVVYASKLFSFAQGTYTFVFDWKANGESTYDYLRVALVPGDVEFAAGTSLPSGVSASSLPNTWIALDGGSKLNLVNSWQTKTSEAAVSGTYTMVFIWRNDGSGGEQPPAAIDNISISYMTCPRPTNLTSSDVTGRTATLTWTENGTATNWVLQYATNNTFTENLVEVNVSAMASKSLSGLAPETQYYARVKSVLGNEESSWSDVANFTTLATCPKPTLSYVSYSNTAYTGSVSWTGSTADAYEVAYRPKNDFDPSDMTLTDVTRVQLENVSEYTYTLQNLTPETKYYIYIQANCGAEDGVSLWSNRVTFTTLATCLAPSYLTDEEVTSTSVILSWTKGAEDQDAWQFRYKKSSDSEYTYVLVENNPSNYYELTGLEPATSYDVNVRAWCGGDDYSKWSLANQSMDKSITTACAEVMMPYTCDFEGAVETGGNFSTYSVPKCWNRIEMQYGSYSPYTYYPYVYDYSSDAHGGTKSLRMYRTPNSATQTIIMPAIDDSYQMSDLQVRFWAKAGSSNNTLYVGVMEGDSFVEVAAVEGVSSTYAEFTVPLSNYTGTGRNIAIRCGSSTGYSYLYFNIDDVLVEVIPTCWVPTALAVKETSYNSASLTWNSGKDESEWNIQYKKTSESEWGNPIHVTSLPDNDNPYVLTGLKRGADYDVRVQAYCDADDQSEWCNPISFTTDCGVWPIDDENALFEGFSGDAFPPACWDWIRVNNYTGWQHSTNVNDPIDPTGTAFSYWPNGDTYLILPHMHINGNAILSFDMTFSSSGSGEESSVVLSTTGMTALDFSKTLWTATEFPTTKTNVSIDLSDYDGQDVYVAFKFAGVGTTGRMWYVDNVGVYCKSYPNVVPGYTANTDGWRLIASPLAETILANDVLNMTTGDFDLYRFNQSADNQWENWKADGAAHYHFGLESGRGYLYANDDNTTITFIGTTYTGNGEVTLSRVAGSSLAGWNLIGNPFAQAATMTKDFYVMNNDGSGLIASTGHNVAAMEGIMVYAETDGEIVTFMKNTRNTVADEQIVLNLSRYEGNVIDRVIVRFGEGSTLPKYSLDNNSAKVYVPLYDNDYSVVRTNGQDEIPVNFNTGDLGKYVLNVSVETANSSYLHLIDKITGTDVDLLKNPEYSFIGSPRDAEDRFIVRFRDDKQIVSANDIIAYQSGSAIVVNGEGELQVYDMMGRMVSSLEIHGTQMIPAPTQGVYILRVIGDSGDLRLQKIVIR